MLVPQPPICPSTKGPGYLLCLVLKENVVLQVQRKGSLSMTCCCGHVRISTKCRHDCDTQFNPVYLELNLLWEEVVASLFLSLILNDTSALNVHNQSKFKDPIFRNNWVGTPLPLGLLSFHIEKSWWLRMVTTINGDNWGIFSWVPTLRVIEGLVNCHDMSCDTLSL